MEPLLTALRPWTSLAGADRAGTDSLLFFCLTLDFFLFVSGSFPFIIVLSVSL